MFCHSISKNDCVENVGSRMTSSSQVCNDAQLNTCLGPAINISNADMRAYERPPDPGNLGRKRSLGVSFLVENELP